MIRNKKESDEEIIRLGLNSAVEEVFDKSNLDKLDSFLNENPYPFYNIRDKSKSSGQFLYKLTREEVLLHCKEYDRFSVYESLCAADENLILQGDIFISDKFKMLASLDDRKGIPLREATKHPKYSLEIDLKDQREPSIDGLAEAINYVTKHQLFNVYVELTVYAVSVGIKKENILVWELRNY